MKRKGMMGRLLITPTNKAFKQFEIPEDKDKETWFCTETYGGEKFYYDGKTQESAAGSYHESIVTVLQSHEEEYDDGK